MSDHDTLRWGDTQGLTIPGGGIATTGQLLHAFWQRPLAWKLLVVIAPQPAAGETGSFVATLNLTIGIGQGLGTVRIALPPIAPVGGVYPALVQNFDIPAQDVQLSVEVDANGASSEGDSNLFTVSAFIAPFTEPRVMADLRDALCNPEGYQSRANAHPDGQGQERWMPPGFDDGMLRYR